MLSGDHSCNRKIGAMNSVLRGCALLVMAFMGWTEPALARSYLNCLTKKVVIVDAPRGSTSSSVEEHLEFWIDEAAKTLMLADGTPLINRSLSRGIFERWFLVERSDFFRVVLQLAHGCADLGLEIDLVGDRHAANSVGLEVFPDQFIWIAVG